MPLSKADPRVSTNQNYIHYVQLNEHICTAFGRLDNYKETKVYLCPLNWNVSSM
jgi:hypothetical protein